jgi:hypothetical protein
MSPEEGEVRRPRPAANACQAEVREAREAGGILQPMAQAMEERSEKEICSLVRGDIGDIGMPEREAGCRPWRGCKRSGGP